MEQSHPRAPLQLPEGAVDGSPKVLVNWAYFYPELVEPYVKRAVEEKAPSVTVVRESTAPAAVPQAAWVPPEGSGESTAPAPEHRDEVAELLERLRAAEKAGLLDEALEVTERVLAREPDHEEARTGRDRLRQQLLARYLTRLGGMEEVPRVLRPPHPEDPALQPEAESLYQRVDGRRTYGEIVAGAGLPKLEACRILAALVGTGLVGS